MDRKVPFIALRILVGLLFLFSAYTKISPVEYFEFQLVNDHLATWGFTSYLARVIIGFEFFLGLCFLSCFDWKGLVVKSSLALMVLFTAYLLLTLALRGNQANCNCFGAFIKVSTAESLIKNVVILAILLAVWRFDQGYTYRFPGAIIPVALIGCQAFVFIYNPVDKQYIKSADANELNYKLDLDFLYKDEHYVKPKTNLMKGKQIVAFLSLTCHHCRLAALKFGIIKNQDPSIPVYFVLNGDSVDLKPFYEETRTEAIPANVVLGQRFVFISGFSLPNIMFLNDGMVERKVSYHEMTKEMIQEWMREK